jgi:hypothetical protein
MFGGGNEILVIRHRMVQTFVFQTRHIAKQA